MTRFVNIFKHHHFKISLILVLLVSVLALDFNSLFVYDAHKKLIQAVSLWEQSFQTEQVLYHLADQDPTFALFPQHDPFILQKEDRYIGQYPIFFAAISAIVYGMVGPAALHFSGMLLSMLALAYFAYRWQPTTQVLYAALLATPIFLFSLEYTETNLVLALGLVGMTWMLYPDGAQLKQDLYLFAGGLCLALATFLRLEALIFFGSLILAYMLFWLRSYGEDRSYYQRVILLSGIGYGLGFLVFVVFNWIDYGHPLGTRFLLNVAEASYNPLDRLKNIGALLFVSSKGPGLFLGSPILLVALWVIWKSDAWRGFSNPRQILLLGTLLALGLLVILAPDAGSFNPIGPRYLALLYFPLLVFVDEASKIRSSEPDRWKFSRWLHRIGFAFSFICIFIVAFTAQSLGGNIYKTFQAELTDLNVDLRVHANRSLPSQLGLLSFGEIPDIMIHEEEDWQKFEHVMQQLPRPMRLAHIIRHDFREMENDSEKLQEFLSKEHSDPIPLQEWQNYNLFRARFLKMCQLKETRDSKYFTAFIYNCD